MATLWTDLWFYVSAGGFLASLALFFMILGRYRAAVETDEEAEPDQPVRSISFPDPEPAKPAPVLRSAAEAAGEKTLVLPPSERPLPVAEAPAPRMEPVLRAAPPPQAAGPAAVEKRRGETTTGGISPAVVYLQNIKMQMEKFDKEIAGLRSLASQQAAQGDLILRQLADLKGRLTEAAAASAARPESRTQSVLKPEPQPEPEAKPQEKPILKAAEEKTQPPAPAEKLVAAAPAPAAASDADATAEMTVTQSVTPPPQAGETGPKLELKVSPPPEKKDAAEEQPKAPRKGPVWPI